MTITSIYGSQLQHSNGVELNYGLERWDWHDGTQQQWNEVFFFPCNCRRKVTCNIEGLICRHLEELSLPYRWKWKHKGAVTSHNFKKWLCSTPKNYRKGGRSSQDSALLVVGFDSCMLTQWTVCLPVEVVPEVVIDWLFICACIWGGVYVS